MSFASVTQQAPEDCSQLQSHFIQRWLEYLYRQTLNILWGSIVSALLISAHGDCISDSNEEPGLGSVSKNEPVTCLDL